MKSPARWILLALSLLACACSGRHERPGSSAGGAQGGAATPGGGSLTLKGSDTMVILSQKWAERFMQNRPGRSVQVTGGGSGTGIAALLNGTADLANASRPMKDRERADLRSQRQVDATEVRVALDALAVYVHASNPVQALTIDQIKGIYRGRITDWSAVGGTPGPIVLYSRENNSGTYAYFKEHVLDDEDFAPTAQTLQGTAAVIASVSADPKGIGYGGIAYGAGARPLRIRMPDGAEVAPTMENAMASRYPISRYLYVYAPGTPTGIAKEFLDFVLSEEGQALVTQIGFYPLPRGGAAPAEAAVPAAATPGTP